MRLLTCIIAWQAFALYMQGFIKFFVIIDAITSKSVMPGISLFPFGDIFWAALFGGLLWGKIKEAPLLKPAYTMALILNFGFHYTLYFTNLGIGSNSITVVALFAVIGVLGALATRAAMSIHFNRNPIESN
jgi:thiamine transporter ThiT